MASVPVVVKHQGKRYDVEIDTSASPEELKGLLYSLTEVEPDRQKVLLAGKLLKDDTDLSTLKIKPKSIVTLMGTPSGGAPKLEKPKEKPKFIEDMTDREIAKKGGGPPAGLENLGNTCYLNSTLQVLKSVPELRETLPLYKPANGTDSRPTQSLLGTGLDLIASLKDLYARMSETNEGFPPILFLNALRTAFPQFAEKSDKPPYGYAQQDAEEAWSQIITQLRQKLKVSPTEQPAGESAIPAQQAKDLSFIDEYMAGRMSCSLECDEPAAKEGGEEASHFKESFLKLNCHITGETNHLHEGLMKGLEETMEKKSQVLDRDAVYTKRSQIERLPKYLTVHFIRFYYKSSTQKKSKIMRKVTFPHELDAVEFCTEPLQKYLIPVRDAIRELRKEERDDERARKRQKLAQRFADDLDAHEADKALQASKAEGAAATDGSASNTVGSAPRPAREEKSEQRLKIEAEIAERKRKLGKPVPIGMAKPEPKEPINIKSDAEIAAERAASIAKARSEIFGLVDPSLLADKGSNPTGLYELRGVITHQGASADSGHYTSYVKKEKERQWDPIKGKMDDEEVEDGKWWWFNDEKVTEVKQEVVEGLAGGGESHSALILLYRAVPLPEQKASETQESEAGSALQSKKATIEDVKDAEMS